jgi:hypothetical protein
MMGSPKTCLAAEHSSNLAVFEGEYTSINFDGGADQISPEKRGGLNGLMQHLLEVFLLGVYEADFVRER